MIQPKFLSDQFIDSHSAIKLYTMGITHAESVWQPPFGGNSVNWIMGHLVVSRCNFLMLLDVPSIWTKDQCMRFIPGSAPVTGDGDSVQFDALLADFDRTQEQLVDALNDASEKDLQKIRDDWSAAETLVYYHAHESHHAGQLEILCVLARY
jgi:hypothetical protein